jgi:hypothetical protein
LSLDRYIAVNELGEECYLLLWIDKRLSQYFPGSA